MSRPVPAATAALRVLRYLSLRSTPVPAQRIALDLGLPRSTTYHLLQAMAAESYVVHYPEDRRWGVGVAAWEVGQGFTRQEPLARLARMPIARLVDSIGLSAHLAALYGPDVIYLVEERAAGKGRLVTDVGARMPAHLTASGRAILAGLPGAQLRALYPARQPLVRRTELGPTSLAELNLILRQTRQRGYAVEDSEVTPGFSSVAVGLRSASNLAALAITWADPLPVELDAVLAALAATAETIEARLR